MSKEDNGQIVTSVAATDHIRVIKDGISSRITKANLASSLSTNLSGDLKIRSVSAAADFIAGDAVILADTSGGGFSVTLGNPSSFYDSTNGVSKVIHLVQSVSGGNTLTLNRFSAENIYVNGAAATSVAITGGSSATLVTDGTDYFVIG